MSEAKISSRERKTDKRKRTIKIISVIVLFITVIIVFTIAWFTFFKSDEANGLNMGAVGRDSIDGTVNAYYTNGSGSGDGDWSELTDSGIKVYPDDKIVVKLILSNTSEQAVDYKLKYSSLKVKYYQIQPFDQNLWTSDDDGYWKNGETEFGYDKSYVMAGDYTTGGAIIDYHSITTEQYMEFIKPATNALRYNLSGFTTAEGTTVEEQLESAKAMMLSSTIYNNAVENAKTAPIICQTEKQDLSKLNVKDPVDVEPSDSGFDYYLTNVIDSSSQTGSNIDASGNVHLEANTTGVIYMTIYFDPLVYSTVTLNIDGVDKEVTMENSNAFMFQSVYLNGIKLEIQK